MGSDMMQKPDWKVIAAIAVAAVAVVSAFLALNPDTGISGFFTALEGQQSNISFTANFDGAPFSVSVQASRLTLSLPKDSEGLSISGQKLDLSALNDVEIIFIGWNGKVDYDDELSLSGSAKKVVVNSIGLTQEGKSQSISGKSIKFNSAKLSSVSIGNLKIENAVGYINVGDGKTQIKVEREPVEIGNFEGDISLDGGIKLEGIAAKLLVSGESKVSVE